jgi:hypothetical protein
MSEPKNTVCDCGHREWEHHIGTQAMVCLHCGELQKDSAHPAESIHEFVPQTYECLLCSFEGQTPKQLALHGLAAHGPADEMGSSFNKKPTNQKPPGGVCFNGNRVHEKHIAAFDPDATGMIRCVRCGEGLVQRESPKPPREQKRITADYVEL